MTRFSTDTNIGTKRLILNELIAQQGTKGQLIMKGILTRKVLCCNELVEILTWTIKAETLHQAAAKPQCGGSAVTKSKKQLKTSFFALKLFQQPTN